MMIFKGQELEHDLDMGIDLDGVVTLTVRYVRGDGTVITPGASRVGQTDTVRHVLSTTELNSAGDWYANPIADYGGGKVVPGETVTFRVYELGEPG